MRFLKKFFRKNKTKSSSQEYKKAKKNISEEDTNGTNSEQNESDISTNIDDNIKKLEEIFKDCDDIVFKNFVIGPKLDTKLVMIYIDGLVDKTMITDNVTQALMQQARGRKPEDVKKNLYEVIEEGNISAPEMKDVYTVDDISNSILGGDTVLIIEGYQKAMVIGSKGWPTRGVSEPQSESLVRGPRDGFNETLKTNITLVRRRVRDTKLKVKSMQIGKRSQTDVALLYISDIADERIVNEARSRLKEIDIDAVLESSYIEEFIEDNNYTIFPQMENTERPDAVASALYEGRVAILVDNTPFALLIPVNINSFFQSSEDYYERWTTTFIVRPIRYLAATIAIFAPAFYVAVTSYHPGLLPTRLALHIAASRSTTPFPAFLETFMMILTVEFLRESGTRISGPIGTTIGVVGGLVIGQSAVEAGLVSPLMVIITALTTISIFMIPNYNFSATVRILCFTMMILASVLGFYGMMLGAISIGIHLSKLVTFGTPYLSPFGIMGKYLDDFQDTFIRLPINKMKKRARFGHLTDQTKLPNDKEN